MVVPPNKRERHDSRTMLDLGLDNEAKQSLT